MGDVALWAKMAGVFEFMKFLSCLVVARNLCAIGLFNGLRTILQT